MGKLHRVAGVHPPGNPVDGPGRRQVQGDVGVFEHYTPVLFSLYLNSSSTMPSPQSGLSYSLRASLRKYARIGSTSILASEPATSGWNISRLSIIRPRESR